MRGVLVHELRPRDPRGAFVTPCTPELSDSAGGSPSPVRLHTGGAWKDGGAKEPEAHSCEEMGFRLRSFELFRVAKHSEGGSVGDKPESPTSQGSSHPHVLLSLSGTQ